MTNKLLFLLELKNLNLYRKKFEIQLDRKGLIFFQPKNFSLFLFIYFYFVSIFSYIYHLDSQKSDGGANT